MILVKKSSENRFDKEIRMKFNSHWVNSRKDLLHFVEENENPNILKDIPKDLEWWVAELNILNLMLTRDDLVAGIGLEQPPVNEPDFNQLGNDTFLYRGKYGRLRGLWIRKYGGKDLEEITGSRFEWTHYRMGTRAQLIINQEFSNIPHEEFLPENFEPISEKVEKENGVYKRPIFKFPVKINGKQITVYAKGALISLSNYYGGSKPRHRLTSISSIDKTTSRREMDITRKLEDSGIKVPRVVGYYQSSVEEFLFLQEVKGDSPINYLNTHRNELIRQDANMLATLCSLGYRKIGFTDFDDKIFDGTNLFLVDVDEFRDLYFGAVQEFREILLDPNNTEKLKDFRKLQRSIFLRELKDAIFGYKGSLTRNEEDKVRYIKRFYQSMGWEQPTEGQIKRFVKFPKDYVTHDVYMSMMFEG